jgi:phage shock protein B
MEGILGTVALMIIGPIWIISHYATKWKTAKGLTGDDAAMLEDLWKTARRMDDRVETLEAILDDNVKGWRNKA